MGQPFNCIGLIGRYGDSSVGDTLKTLSNYLKHRAIKVWLEEATANRVPDHGLETASLSTMGTSCDLVIVVGGDGTLLNAARALVGYSIPLLGINLGRLGFLVDLSASEMLVRLDEILDGHYLQEERILLYTEILREGKCVSSSDALNDVVVHKWNVARMIELDTYINGQFVNNHRSDGIIIATPTGSTAYALSSGGPILHPALDAIVLVPICPHTMSNRPIVVQGGSQIEIVVKDSGRSHAQVTCDGQITLNIAPGDRIKIQKKDQPIRLLHPANHDPYAILRAKLHWGGQL
jgi:NAD+ kinase